MLQDSQNEIALLALLQHCWEWSHCCHREVVKRRETISWCGDISVKEVYNTWRELSIRGSKKYLVKACLLPVTMLKKMWLMSLLRTVLIWLEGEKRLLFSYFLRHIVKNVTKYHYPDIIMKKILSYIILKTCHCLLMFYKTLSAKSKSCGATNTKQEMM